MNAEAQKVESRPATPRPAPFDSFVSGVFWTVGAVLAGLVVGRLLPREPVYVVLVEKDEDEDE